MSSHPDSSSIRIIPEPEMPPAVDQRIRDGLCICFPADQQVFSQTRAWHGSTPAYSVVIECDDRIIAHVGVVDRRITAGQQSLRVGGIQNVMVLPEYRGRGLAERVMHAAAEESLRRDFDFGLLFCVPPLQSLYHRCGWTTLSDRPVIRVENGQECPLPGKNIAMVYPISSKPFPSGPIHLGGNDW